MKSFHLVRVVGLGRVVRNIGGEAFLARLPNMEEHPVGGHLFHDFAQGLRFPGAAVHDHIDAVGPFDTIAVAHVFRELSVIPVAVGTCGFDPVAVRENVQLEEGATRFFQGLVGDEVLEFE